MKHILKIFTVVVLIGAAGVLTTSIILSADQQGVIQLKNFTPPTPTPSPTPATTPTPTSVPTPIPNDFRSTPPPTHTPPPNPSPTPPTPNLPPPPAPDLPTPGRPYDANFCSALLVLYSLDVFSSSPTYYSMVYPNLDYITSHKDEVLNDLKQDPNFAKINSDLGTQTGQAITNSLYATVLDLLTKGVGDSRILPDQVAHLANLTYGPSQRVDDIYNFYVDLFKLINYAYSVRSLQVDMPGNPQGRVHGTTTYILNGLRAALWPKLPFIVLNPRQSTAEIDPGGYPLALDWMSAVEQLGCNGIRPPFVFSATPAIYLYAPSALPVNIKIGRQVTYSNPSYSLVNGFNVIAQPGGTKLYYEFLKDNDLRLKINDLKELNSTVVKGENLKNYLFNTLLPRLNLTDQELKDYQEDISSQLTTYSLQPTTNYQITLLQNEQVDNLVPLSITPKPDTLIRNMIIIKQTNLPADSSQITADSSLRKGFTAVENGFAIH